MGSVAGGFELDCHAKELLVVENLEGGDVAGGGGGIAPLPKFSQDGEARRLEAAGAVDAPGVFLVAVGALEDVAAESGAALGEPIEPALFRELADEDVGDATEVTDVIDGVGLHLRRQGALAPVGLLRTLAEDDA